MAHEDIIVDSLGKNFVENLDNLLFKIPDVDEAMNAIITAMDTELGSKTIDDFLAQAVYISNTPPQPDNLDVFTENLVNFSDKGNPDATAVIDAFTNTISGILNRNDWDVFVNPTVAGDDVEIDDAFAVSVRNSINHFLASFPDNKIPVDLTQINFFTEFRDFYTRTSKLSESTVTGANLPAYELVYNGYGLPQEDFQPRMREFLDDSFSEDGYFIPSQRFDEWFEEITREFAISKSFGIDNPDGLLGTIDLTGSDEVNSRISKEARIATKRTLVIDRILKLLVLVIDTLHIISAGQAARLSFLADWQQNYTLLMEEIRTFTSRTRHPVTNALIPTSHPIGTATAAQQSAQRRGDLNALNTQFTETLRARRDIVGDDSKTLQSTINQSQDAANQQTSIATSILQQISTILSAIFR